jgi:hypothetical protein
MPRLGATAWTSALPRRIRKADTELVGNYLTREELWQLELPVEQHLSFAELRACCGKPMRSRSSRWPGTAKASMRDR